MSMTVDNVSYFTGTRQNTHVSAAEKREQTGTSADAGKVEQSSVSASLDQVNMGEDGIAVTEVSRWQEAERPTAQKQPAVRDVAEISAEGRAASAQGQQAAATETEQYEVEDLSEYTDSELKRMYYSGEITLQEYEDETGETLE